MLGKILEDLIFIPFSGWSLSADFFFKFHALTEFLRPFFSAIIKNGERELEKF